MRITIAFLLKASKKTQNDICPIYARFTYKGKRAEISTKVFTEKEAWDNLKERMAGSSNKAKTINNRLDKIATNILDIYNQFEAQDKSFNVTDIKNELCGIDPEHGIVEMFDTYMDTIKANIGKGFSATTLNTIKHHEPGL